MQPSLLDGSLTFTRYSGRSGLDNHNLHFFWSVGVCFGGEGGGYFACDARDYLFCKVLLRLTVRLHGSCWESR
jgi:hypothetical protein